MAYARPSSRKISAGVILVDPQGRVLLQLRDDDPKIMFPGHWGLTGGAGNPGETPEQIAHREVNEETGLVLPKITPFRAYYFNENRGSTGKRGAASKRSADYELYLFHAPCGTPAGELLCGEGRELRFFAPSELDALDLAYNHGDVLADFFVSAAYAPYVFGAPFGEHDTAAEEFEPLAQFLASLEAGDPWFDALMRAIALWEQPDELASDGRRYRYLIGGEAFDWLLLAERLIEEAGDRLPAAEVERLLFEGIAPPDDDATEPAPPPRMSDDRLRAAIGEAKHRAHLNYLYGVIVEEALQYAVELDLSKESRSNYVKDPRAGDETRDPVFERIYGESRSSLLREFRDEQRLAHADHISLSELREFMYWLFKYRVAHTEPARVASDTRKALAQLASMELAVRRRTQTQTAEPDPDEVLIR
ncbi:MAG: NUDIX domain-containing protein [Chloroflexota bacterium]|nr:NUDIX domain-containing protein [Chloroflexota bacterium]